jgi:hypothetical protein
VADALLILWYFGLVMGGFTHCGSMGVGRMGVMSDLTKILILILISLYIIVNNWLLGNASALLYVTLTNF